MVCAMRCTTWRTLVSPTALSPCRPALRKYLETTMSVASCDQPVGISAPSILKTTEPSELVMTLVRPSQVMSARASPEAVVKRRSKVRPRVFFAARLLGGAVGTAGDCVDGVDAADGLLVALFTRLFS